MKRSRRQVVRSQLVNPYATGQDARSPRSPSIAAGAVLAGAAGLVALGAGTAAAEEQHDEVGITSTGDGGGDGSVGTVASEGDGARWDGDGAVASGGDGSGYGSGGADGTTGNAVLGGTSGDDTATGGVSTGGAGDRTDGSGDPADGGTGGSGADHTSAADTGYTVTDATATDTDTETDTETGADDVVATRSAGSGGSEDAGERASPTTTATDDVASASRATASDETASTPRATATDPADRGQDDTTGAPVDGAGGVDQITAWTAQLGQPGDGPATQPELDTTSAAPLAVADTTGAAALFRGTPYGEAPDGGDTPLLTGTAPVQLVADRSSTPVDRGAVDLLPPPDGGAGAPSDASPAVGRATAAATTGPVTDAPPTRAPSATGTDARTDVAADGRSAEPALPRTGGQDAVTGAEDVVHAVRAPDGTGTRTSPALRDRPGVLVASADVPVGVSDVGTDLLAAGGQPPSTSAATAGRTPLLARADPAGGQLGPPAPVVVDYRGTGWSRSRPGQELRVPGREGGTAQFRITPTATDLPDGTRILEWEDYSGSANRYDPDSGEIVIDGVRGDAQSRGTRRMVVPADAPLRPPVRSDAPTGTTAGTTAPPADPAIGRLTALPDGKQGVVVDVQRLAGTDPRDVPGSVVTVWDPRDGQRYASVQPSRTTAPDGVRLLVPEVAGEQVASSPTGNTVAVYRLPEGETARVTPQTPVRPLPLTPEQREQVARAFPGTTVEPTPEAGPTTTPTTPGTPSGDGSASPFPFTINTDAFPFTFDPDTPNPYKGPIYATSGAIASFLTQRALNPRLTAGQFGPNGARGWIQDNIFINGAPCVQFGETWSDAALRGLCGAAANQALSLASRRILNPTFNSALDAYNTDPRLLAMNRLADPATAGLLNQSLRTNPPPPAPPRSNLRFDFGLGTGRLDLPLLDPRTTLLSPDPAANTSATRLDVGAVPDTAPGTAGVLPGEAGLDNGAARVDAARNGGRTPVRPDLLAEAPELRQPTRRQPGARLPDTRIPPFPTYGINPRTGRYEQGNYNIFEMRDLPREMQTRVQRITDASAAGMNVGGALFHEGYNQFLKANGLYNSFPAHVTGHSLIDSLVVGTAISAGEGRFVRGAFVNPLWQSALAQTASGAVLAFAPKPIRDAYVDTCSDENPAVNAGKWMVCNLGEKGQGGLPPTTPPDGTLGGAIASIPNGTGGFAFSEPSAPAAPAGPPFPGTGTGTALPPAFSLGPAPTATDPVVDGTSPFLAELPSPSPTAPSPTAPSPALTQQQVDRPATPSTSTTQQPESEPTGAGATLRQWASDFVNGPWTMTRSEDGSTYRAAWGPPWSASVGVYDATTGQLLRTEKGTPPARVNTGQYMDPTTGALVAAAALAPGLTAKVLQSGGGSLAGAGVRGSALPALPAVVPALPLASGGSGSVPDAWNGIVEDAGQLWRSVAGAVTGSGSARGALRVGDGTPEGAAAANEYNLRELGIRTNYVGRKQPPPATTAPGTGTGGGSGDAAGGTDAGAEPVSAPPGTAARVDPAGSSGPSGPSGADPVAAVSQAVADRVQPVVEQVQQRAEEATAAAAGLVGQVGDRLDAAADAAQKAPIVGGVVGWLRDRVPAFRGDGNPDR